jgi:hypothetical protein
MPGLTPHARYSRYQLAMNTLYHNPCKNLTIETFMNACRVIESCERYWETHPNSDFEYQPVLPKLTQAFYALAKEINWDPDQAEATIQEVLNLIKTKPLTDVNL